MAYLSNADGIERSWSAEWKRYLAEPKVSRWENCREQGYVVWMRNEGRSNQINIAFYEHRNSDSICAIRWEQITINAPTIDTAKFGDVYKDKYDVSKTVDVGRADEMASWIMDELISFYKPEFAQRATGTAADP